MAKSSTGIHGLFDDWRPARHHDAYRVAIIKSGEQIWISSKIHPTLRQINAYLKSEKLHEADASKNNTFISLKHRLWNELKQEHSLSEYRARERVDLITKSFNFEQSLDEFAEYKSDTSVPMKHRSILVNVWLPFFLGKGCKHPREFIQWRTLAQKHVRNAIKLDGTGPYATESRVSLTNAINEYMRWLRDEDGSITDDEFFTLRNKITTEQKKRGTTKHSRKRDTYNEDEVLTIKELIDQTYKDDLTWKLRAYAMYFGVCTGLRRGNLLGLRSSSLHPDSEVPHFVTEDNIVEGWSRGIRGAVTLETCSKTFVGAVTLPFIQPDVRILQEVARFLQMHLKPEDRLLSCAPSTVDDWWKRIARECGFKYLSPHDWRHSYATIGSRHIQDWYRGNVMLLKNCCMHEDLRTTNKYVNQKGQDFLKAFSEKR